MSDFTIPSFKIGVDGGGTKTELILVDAADAPLPYDYAEAKVAEDQVRVLGETPELQPNDSAALDLTLSAGSYLLFCNIQGHYASGMVVPLTVTP